MKTALRVAAAVSAVAFLLYRVLMAINAKSAVGVNSKLHGVLIIVLGVVLGRYAVLGRSGLRILDER